MQYALIAVTSKMIILPTANPVYLMPLDRDRTPTPIKNSIILKLA